MALFVKGQVAWNKGKKLHYPVWNKGLTGLSPRHVTPHTEKSKLKCSLSQKKRWNMGVYKDRINITPESIEKGRNTQRKNSPKGKNHWLWKGGLNYNTIYRTSEYREWRRFIFVRDEFTCQKCGKKHIYIEAHHIKVYSKFPKLKFDKNNGITLCNKCHKKMHKKRERTK